MDREAWQATVHVVPESDTIEQLSVHAHTHTHTTWLFNFKLKLHKISHLVLQSH